MTVREYVGARYVPLFVGDWDIDADYEPLSIVQYQGNTYTSRQSVPHGVPITDTHYWAVTGNFNAQVEAYRQEVLAFDGRITANTDDISDIQDTIGNGFSEQDTITAFKNQVSQTFGSNFDATHSVTDALGSNYTSQNTVADAIAGVADTIGEGFTSQNTVADAIEGVTDAIEGVTDTIGEGFTSQNTVADAIEATANIPRTNSFTGFQQYFVCYTSGNDNNDGLTSSTALKTVDKALELAQIGGYNNLTIRLYESGYYTVSEDNFANCNLHITAGGSAVNVELTFNNQMRFYNSYIHFEAGSSISFTVVFASGAHFDFCALYTVKTKIVAHNRLDNHYGGLWLTSSTEINILDCTWQLNSCTLRTSNTITFSGNTKQWVYGHNVQAEIAGDMVIVNTSETDGSSLLRFDESLVFVQPTSVSVTTSKNWTNFLLITRCFATANSAFTTAGSNYATTDIGGSMSYVKTNSSVIRE